MKTEKFEEDEFEYTSFDEFEMLMTNKHIDRSDDSPSNDDDDDEFEEELDDDEENPEEKS